MNKSSTRLLAINFGGIGDEILFLPTLRTFKESHPDWHITLLLEPRSKSIKEITNLIDEVITFDIKKRPLMTRDLLELVGLLRDGDYSQVVSSGSSPLVSMLLFLSGIPERVGYRTGKFSGLLSHKLLTKPVPLKREQYAAQMYLDLAGGFGLTGGSAQPEIIVPEANKLAMSQFVEDSLKTTKNKPKALVLIHPGTSLLSLKKGIVKTWQSDQWSTLIERLAAQEGLQTILAGGPDDGAAISAIMQRLAQNGLVSRVISAFGQTKSLADLAALIQLAQIMVCVDSAPMHIGVALGKPMVCLFGPTDHKLLLPANPAFKALDSKAFVRQTRNGKINQQRRAHSGVQLPTDIVFQSVLDQLQLSTSQEHFR
jgi:ADP-heptose:LPS heptosyltransferase